MTEHNGKVVFVYQFYVALTWNQGRKEGHVPVGGFSVCLAKESRDGSGGSSEGENGTRMQFCSG